MSYYANNEWLQALYEANKYGTEHAPRGEYTRELLGRKIQVHMKWPIITVVERKLSYKFMAAEALWILSGDNKVETIAKYNKNIAKYSDDGLTYFGAYGPKFVDQIAYVARALLKDHDTRQAVMNIWREKPYYTKDVPCTLSVQWMLRHGKLHCFVSMRSSDIWLGLPYNIFNFSMMSHYLMLYLETLGLTVSIGDLHLTAASMHLYEQHWEPALKLLKQDSYNSTFIPERVVRHIEPTVASFIDFDHFNQYLMYAKNHGFELEGRRVADQSN